MSTPSGGRGKFITLEGGEGAGKSTQARMLADRLEAAGIDTILTREPGGSPGAEEIRALLVSGETGRWTPMTEVLLHYAARLDHLARTVSPALDAGKWVISDRFADSTIAYQGYGHRLGAEAIEALHRIVLGDMGPDMTFILDIPVEVGLERTDGIGNQRSQDRYLRMGADFHRRVRQGFKSLAKQFPYRCNLVDAMKDPAQVHEAIWSILARSGLASNSQDPATHPKS